MWKRQNDTETCTGKIRTRIMKTGYSFFDIPLSSNGSENRSYRGRYVRLTIKNKEMKGSYRISLLIKAGNSPKVTPANNIPQPQIHTIPIAA
jgi:hypothetical protein